MIVAHTEVDEGREERASAASWSARRSRASAPAARPSFPRARSRPHTSGDTLSSLTSSSRACGANSRHSLKRDGIQAVADRRRQVGSWRGRVSSGVRELIDGADEILVVTPALPNRLDWLASATDKAREQADERLSSVLEQLAETDTKVSGEVGADDPMLAFEDALRDFEADHILVALRPDEEADWQERGLLEQVRERFSLPTTVFEVR